MHLKRVHQSSWKCVVAQKEELIKPYKEKEEGKDNFGMLSRFFLFEFWNKIIISSLPKNNWPNSTHLNPEDLIIDMFINLHYESISYNSNSPQTEKKCCTVILVAKSKIPLFTLVWLRNIISNIN